MKLALSKIEKKGILIFFLLTLFLLSCSKDHTSSSSMETELYSFSIPDSLNPKISNTIVGKIEDSKINLEIPGLLNQKELIPVFEFEGNTLHLNGKAIESGKTKIDFSKDIKISITTNDNTREYEMQIKRSSILPHIYINTDNKEEINSKEKYTNAYMVIAGQGAYKNYAGRTKLRGRGNSTWNLPKKPYKLKLASKANLFGLSPAKKWILLAEYLDGSMLYNAIPFKMGEMLGMPYTNHIIPVQVTLNGKYQGFYGFTEHKEVKKGRIAIGEDGWLLELDSYFDEPLKFKSEKYNLPVMLKFPKAKNMTTAEGEAVLSVIKNDFNKMESLIFDDQFPQNNYLEFIDEDAFINYMLVYELTRNREISHPKSTYINKKKNGKYNMGIIWDFDWGFGYGGIEHYRPSAASGTIFNSNEAGARFFSRIMEDPHMQKLFRKRWDEFRSEHYEDLKTYVNAYAEQVRQAFKKDHEIWGPRDSTGDLDNDLKKMLTWLDARANYIDALYR